MNTKLMDSAKWGLIRTSLLPCCLDNLPPQSNIPSTTENEMIEMTIAKCLIQIQVQIISPHNLYIHLTGDSPVENCNGMLSIFN